MSIELDGCARLGTVVIGGMGIGGLGLHLGVVGDGGGR